MSLPPPPGHSESSPRCEGHCRKSGEVTSGSGQWRPVPSGQNHVGSLQYSMRCTSQSCKAYRLWIADFRVLHTNAESIDLERAVEPPSSLPFTHVSVMLFGL